MNEQDTEVLSNALKELDKKIVAYNLEDKI
jgi:hypothetical protein